MTKPIIAIMYDFDKTLCTRDMQEYTFIPSVGMEPHEFWNHTAEVAAEEVMDSILTYLYCMVEKANQSGNPLTRESLVACGKDIEYFPGVEDWFERINRYAEEAGVQVVVINYIGPVVGTHSGPGTLAMFFVGTER